MEQNAEKGTYRGPARLSDGDFDVLRDAYRVLSRLDEHSDGYAYAENTREAYHLGEWKRVVRSAQEGLHTLAMVAEIAFEDTRGDFDYDGE